jgi:hypothetical protein
MHLAAWRALPLLAVLTASCGHASGEDSGARAITAHSPERRRAGQRARAVALQTEVRSAGRQCGKVIRTFKQGVRDGGDAWNVGCDGGEEYGIVSAADGSTEVLECEALEREVGKSCWTPF